MATKRPTKRPKRGSQIEPDADPAGQAEDTAAIKRLLTLMLVKLGATSDELAWALGVTGRRVRQVVPITSIKKVVVANRAEE
jgi:hypothetical protein